MKVKQLSVFVENKKGRLSAITELLAENHIDISALSLADTSEFGVLRLIVNDIERAKTVLRESGVIVKSTDVIAVAMNDIPGGAGAVLSLMSQNDIDVEYMYACTGKVTGKALMLIRVSDAEKAEALICENGYGNTNPADIYRI